MLLRSVRRAPRREGQFVTHDATAARALHIADQALGLLRRGELDRARALRIPAERRVSSCGDPQCVGRVHRGLDHSKARHAFDDGPYTEAPCPVQGTILFVSNDFTTLAGSQIYATRWRDDLERRGLPVASCDVLTLFARDRAELAQNVGAIVTWGDSSQHIVRRFFGAPLSPPLVALTGNVADSRTDPGWLADLVVCSTQHARTEAGGPGAWLRATAPDGSTRETSSHANAAIVLHPPIAPVYFETPILPLSERRALVQINMSKRPEIFEALARAMPDTPFIAVRGWGVQQIPSLPNVRELPQAPESPMLAYREARVLIQPGIESYGLAAAEAGAMGVTACVNSTGNGAMETMADFGMSERDIGNVEVAKWIELVRWTMEKDRGSNRRDALLARQRTELDAAADALARVMGR